MIDVQITAASLEPGGALAAALAAAGFPPRADILSDHLPPGERAPEDWAKWLLEPPSSLRPANVHVRVAGRPNQRYALLFRDYLLENPVTAAAYAELKRRLAAIAPTRAAYADTKDPACDLIMGAAEEWADVTGWDPGPSGLDPSSARVGLASMAARRPGRHRSRSPRGRARRRFGAARAPSCRGCAETAALGLAAICSGSSQGDALFIEA